MSERLRQKLRKDRPMTTAILQLPEDVLDEVKEVATRLGFSGYPSLMRAYIGRGLRSDLTRSEKVLFTNKSDLYILWCAMLSMVEDNHAAQDGMSEEQWVRAKGILDQLTTRVEKP